MKLHSPAYERRLRRGVKRRIRESASLRKEYRNARKTRQPRRFARGFRICLSLGFGVVVVYLTSQPPHPLTGLAGLALWFFIASFLHANQLWNCLQTDGDLAVLRILPAPEPVIFRWQLQKFVKRALFAFGDLVIGLAALAVVLRLSWWQWVAVPVVAFLAWATLLALAALWTALLPRTLCQFLAGGLPLAGFAMLFLWQMIAKPLRNALDIYAADLLWFLPTGWPLSLFQWILPDRSWRGAALLLPMGCIAASVAYSLNRLRRGFHFDERVVPETHDIVPESDDDVDEDAIASEESWSGMDEQKIRHIIQARGFLAPVRWDRRGRWERLLWGWLNDREKALCEFAFPNGYGMTADWLKILRNLLIAWTLGLAAGYVSAPLGSWTLGAGLLVTGLHVLGQVCGSGVAFRSVSCSGANIPIYATVGVGYGELSRFLLKCSVVQLPALLVFTMAWGALSATFWSVPWSWQGGIELGLKVGVVLFAIRFVLVALGFSGASNDTARLRWRTLFLVLGVVAGGLVFLGLSAAGFLIPNAPGAWIALALAVLDAYALFRVYGWFYNRNRFDLMSLPRQ